MKDSARLSTFAPTIKGHYKIELNNAKTGEIEHVVEGENHFTYGCLNGLMRSVFYNMFSGAKKSGQTYFSTKSGPAYAYYQDGIQESVAISHMILHNQDATDVAESVHAPCYPSNEGIFTAYSQMACNTINNDDKGLYNDTDSYISPGENKYIVDFTTEKGNGTYNSISLIKNIQANNIDNRYDIFAITRDTRRVPSILRPDCKPISSYHAYWNDAGVQFMSPDKSCCYFLDTGYIKKRVIATGALSDFITSAECTTFANHSRLEIDRYAADSYDIAFCTDQTTLKVFNKTIAGGEVYVGAITTALIPNLSIIYNNFIYDRILTLIYRTNADNTIYVRQYDLSGGTLTSVIGTTSISSTRDATDYTYAWAYIPTTDPTVAYIYSMLKNYSDGISALAPNPIYEFKVNLISGEIQSIESSRVSKYYIPMEHQDGDVGRMFIYSDTPATYFVAGNIQCSCAPSFPSSTGTLNDYRLSVELIAPATAATRNLPYCPICIASQTFTPFTKLNTQTMKVTYTITLSEA